MAEYLNEKTLPGENGHGTLPELWDTTAVETKITKRAKIPSRYGSSSQQVVGIKDDEGRDKCGVS